MLRKAALVVVALLLLLHPASTVWFAEELVESGLDTPRVPQYDNDEDFFREADSLSDDEVGYDTAGALTG